METLDLKKKKYKINMSDVVGKTCSRFGAVEKM